VGPGGRYITEPRYECVSIDFSQRGSGILGAAWFVYPVVIPAAGGLAGANNQSGGAARRRFPALASPSKFRTDEAGLGRGVARIPAAIVCNTNSCRSAESCLKPIQIKVDIDKVRYRPIGRNPEDELNFADVGGKEGSSKHINRHTPFVGPRHRPAVVRSFQLALPL
jgi:hypothetical protein